MSKGKKISEWTNDEVEKVFSYVCDEMSSVEADDVIDENPTIENKRDYLIAVQERFEYCF